MKKIQISPGAEISWSLIKDLISIHGEDWTYEELYKMVPNYSPSFHKTLEEFIAFMKEEMKTK
jgi:hypothetical protein